MTITEAKHAITEIVRFSDNPTDHNKRLLEVLEDGSLDEIASELEDE